jgi:hypothetical protein
MVGKIQETEQILRLMTPCMMPVSMLIIHETTVLCGVMQTATFPLLNITHTKMTQAFIFLHLTLLLCVSDTKFPPNIITTKAYSHLVLLTVSRCTYFVIFMT